MKPLPRPICNETNCLVPLSEPSFYVSMSFVLLNNPSPFREGKMATPTYPSCRTRFCISSAAKS